MRASVPNPHSSCIVVIAISAVLFQAMSMNASGSSAAWRTSCRNVPVPAYEAAEQDMQKQSGAAGCFLSAFMV